MERRARVLIAEEDELLRQMIGRVLCGLGCACTHAEDASRALELAANDRFDLIVAEAPASTGEEPDLVAGIRRSDANASTPILMLSGLDEVSDEVMRRHGVQGYLPKPFSREMLEDTASLLLASPL